MSLTKANAVTDVSAGSTVGVLVDDGESAQGAEVVTAVSIGSTANAVTAFEDVVKAALVTEQVPIDALQANAARHEDWENFAEIQWNGETEQFVTTISGGNGNNGGQNDN